MLNKLTNLLPPERQRALSRAYALRFVVVAVILTIILTLFAMALLLPAYVFLTASMQAKETRLATLESTLAPADDAELTARLTKLSTSASQLTALATIPSASALIRSVLALPRPGIVLSGLTYAPSADKRTSTITVSGLAATREALRGYQIALQGAPLVRTAALPVSAYAKDADIPFTITVTLAP